MASFDTNAHALEAGPRRAAPGHDSCCAEGRKEERARRNVTSGVMTHMPRVLGGRDVEASGKLLRGGLAALSFSASSAMSVPCAPAAVATGKVRAERGLFLSEPRHERRAAGGRRNAACPTRPRRAVSGRTEGSGKVREASAALRVVAVLLVVCSARSGLSFSRDWSGEWRKGYNSLSSFSLWDRLVPSRALARKDSDEWEGKVCGRSEAFNGTVL